MLLGCHHTAAAAEEHHAQRAEHADVRLELAPDKGGLRQKEACRTGQDAHLSLFAGMLCAQAKQSNPRWNPAHATSRLPEGWGEFMAFHCTCLAALQEGSRVEAYDKAVQALQPFIRVGGGSGGSLAEKSEETASFHQAPLSARLRPSYARAARLKPSLLTPHTLALTDLLLLACITSAGLGSKQGCSHSLHPGGWAVLGQIALRTGPTT